MSSVNADVIKRIRQIFSVEGTDNVIRAYEAVVSALGRTTNTSISLEKAFTSLERKYVSGVRAQQDYARIQEQVNAAVAQNPALQDRANAVMAAASDKLRGLTSANENYKASLEATNSSLAQRINTQLGVRDDFNYESRAKDIAAYGNELDNLRAKYNPLFSVQRQYKEQLAEIDRAYSVGAITEKERDAAIQRSALIYKKAVRDISDSNGDLSKNTKATRYELINLSRQIQDVFVSIVSGQRLGTVGIQQGTQIFDVFASSSQGAKGLLQSITALITPTVLLGAGLTALVVGVGASVSMWKSYATALDDASKASGVAFESFSKLQGAAEIEGISNSEFASGMANLARSVNLAKSSAGELYTLFRLNGVAVGDTEKSLENVAELISRSTSEEQKLRILEQAGLPKTAEWVRWLSSGREGLEKAKQAIKGIPDDENIKKARELDKTIASIWVNAKRGIYDFGRQIVDEFEKIANSDAFKAVKAAMNFASESAGAVGLGGGPPSGVAIGTAIRNWYDENVSRPLIELFSQPYNPRFGIYPPNPASSAGVSSPPPPPVSLPTSPPVPKPNPNTSGGVKDNLDLEKLQNELQFLQQKNGLMGDLATVEDIVTAKTKELNAVRVKNTEITQENAEKIIEITRAQEEYNRASEKVSILGAAATEVEKYNVAVQGLALNMSKGKINQEGFNRAVAYANPLFSGAASILENNLVSGIHDFASNTKKAKDAFLDMSRNILSELEKLIIKLLIVDPLIKSLAGPFGFITGSANGNVFSGGNVTPFANGTVVSKPTVFPTASGAGLMGEAGPEAIMPLRRGADGRLGVEVNRGKSSDNGGVTIAPVINVTMPPGGEPEDGSKFAEQIGNTLIPLIHSEVGKFMVAQSRGGGRLSRIG